MPVVKARKRPVVIDALLYDGTNVAEVEAFLGADATRLDVADEPPGFFVRTKEGKLTEAQFAPIYFLRGVDHEPYPCSVEIFQKTYDIVVDEAGVWRTLGE